MPVKMRLHRVGAKHQPSYRIVITPSLTPRDGSYLDQVGIYNPVTEPATIRIDRDKAVEWLRKGVQPTDRVARLLASADIDIAEARRGVATTAVQAPTSRAGRTRKAATQVEEVEASAEDQAAAIATASPSSPEEESAPAPARRRTPRKKAPTEGE